ncbi:MAG: hypothetical protein ABH821_04320 [archaeon]
MNEKGIYTPIIAGIIILFIASNYLFGYAMLEKEKSFNEISLVNEVKNEWQKTYYLLDKVSSDAIADSYTANNCGNLTPQNTIDNYYTQLFDSISDTQKDYLVKCAYENVNVTVADLSVSVNLDLECGIETNEISVSFKREGIIFLKNIVVGDPFQVVDSQSNVVEVTQDC